MAAAVLTSRTITSMGGQKKMEVLVTDADVANTNTIDSRMNTLDFAMPFPTTTPTHVSAACSGRTITLHDPSGVTIVLAFGS